MTPPVTQPLVPAVPSAPPRKVEVEVLNSTAIQVFWRSPVPSRQHGQIRGYQVHYVRMENGEARGLPHIKDIMLADAQVKPHLAEPPKRGWEGFLGGPGTARAVSLCRSSRGDVDVSLRFLCAPR